MPPIVSLNRLPGITTKGFHGIAPDQRPDQ
jgi:hypothetical protein